MPREKPDDLLFVAGVDNRIDLPAEMLGLDDGEPGAAILERAAELKGIVFAGLASAVEAGLPKSQVGLWADPGVGEAVLLRARAMAMTTVVSVERPGVTEFQFDDAIGFADRLKGLDATFAGARVRYNPAEDAAANESRRNILRRLSEICRSGGPSLLIELLVRPGADEAEAAGGYSGWETGVRPTATVQAIRDLQDAGVEPDIWALEPPLEATAAATVAAQVHVDDRAATGMLFVVGSDATMTPDDAGHNEIVRLAARTTGVTGLVIGPGAYFDPLARYHEGAIDREAAVERVASSVMQLASMFADARHRSGVS